MIKHLLQYYNKSLYKLYLNGLRILIYWKNKKIIIISFDNSVYILVHNYNSQLL